MVLSSLNAGTTTESPGTGAGEESEAERESGARESDERKSGAPESGTVKLDEYSAW